VNQRRVVGILQELALASARVSALQAELAEAMAEDKPRKQRARKQVQPKAQPSQEAIRDMERKLRSHGVAV
jgi:hypothetical protein